MTRLLRPDPARFEDWAELMADNEDPIPPGSGMWWVPEGVTREGFAHHLALVQEYADERNLLPEQRVHCDQFWIADDSGALVGFLQFRRRLNDFLREQGGHIGYSVRQSRRREGHASTALGLAVDHARRLGIDRVLVTCDDDNLASAATIESQGGTIEDLRNGKRRYWITI